jgi:hypothetical protein
MPKSKESAPYRCRVNRCRTQDIPAHHHRHVKDTRLGLRHAICRRKRYHRTAHEAWHPENPQHLRRSLPPTSKTRISRIYTCTYMHLQPRSTCTAGKSTYACTHPAVPSVGSHRADGKASPHLTRTGSEDRRYKGTRPRRARRCVCVCVCMYVRARCPALLPRRASCIQTSRWQMQHAALCTPRSTPAQRAQPFRDGQMTL